MSQRSFHTTTPLKNLVQTKNKDFSRAPVTWISLLFISGALGGLTYHFLNEKERIENEKIQKAKERETSSIGKPKIGGPFSLVDENGVRRTEKDFLGKFMMVYFGFTFCPDICPIELTKMGEVMKHLESSAEFKDIIPLIQPIFISVDPKRDTLSAIKEYTKEFHPKLLGMTGTKEEIAKVAKSYRVYFSMSDDDEKTDDYLVDHSIFIYLMGPDGQLMDYYGQQLTSEQIINSIQGHLREFKTQSSTAKN